MFDEPTGKQLVSAAEKGHLASLGRLLRDFSARRKADALAAAGSSATDAALIADSINIITAADGAKGVALPAAADLDRVTLVNDSPVYAVKVYPISAGNDSINELAEDDPYILGPEQEVTFYAVSATLWYAAKSNSRTSHAVEFEVFDDFLAAALDTTDNWIVFNGGGTSAASAVTVTAPEGKVNMVSGTAGSAGVADATVMGLILLAKGSLVSLGKTVLEARVSTSHVTGATICIGLSDKLPSGSAEAVLHVIKTEAIADDGLAVTNAISFVQDSEATTPLKWYGVSENAGTIAHVAVAVECIMDTGPTVDAYQVLRIEIDADGDARFYIDGVLKFTELTAVATTALLIPYIAVTAEDATPVSTTLSIDYVKFSGARPAGQ